MTEKGQVTIPIEIRRQLGPHPGDEIMALTRGDRATRDPGRLQRRPRPDHP
ncbi:AbrB/MazE/SpoVT family DNA-binding domain-containing protein [Actinophytocola sp.]|uniref:AbrB/MazE/SpoVT family DNA-binding domain-containing protein n=1 Tax=Actinophytocola sp. TaxID=1872138 RepID=UPI003D6BE090